MSERRREQHITLPQIGMTVHIWAATPSLKAWLKQQPSVLAAQERGPFWLFLYLN